MKTFRGFISEIKSSTEKAGLTGITRKQEEDPKELLNVEIPVKVHSELKGDQGNHELKTDNGKYKISKKGKTEKK